MPCVHVGSAIVCTRGRKAKAWRCGFCGLAGGFQCDWKIGGGKTCDVHLCPDHAKEAAPGKHLCPLHAEAWERWKAERGAPA